jgi:predicted phage terminase large subunit-like protein
MGTATTTMAVDPAIKQAQARYRCETDHLFFTRYFFLARQGIKLLVNWHHVLMADAIEKVIRGEIQNLILNLPPGGSKTEFVVINLMARGLAINPRARFLHLSGSDQLATLNSATTREIIQSDRFQELWPLKIADDAKAKKRWNVEIDGAPAGGVYATSIGGQVTGFRAGHMTPGFQGCIIIDDPIKTQDSYSKVKLEAANRSLITTVKSRRANPKTPIIVVMQRIAENDPVGFIHGGNLDGQWTTIKIPAVLDEKYIASLDPKYRDMIDATQLREGRMSYWAYKEPLDLLLAMERGDGSDQGGSRISRHVFSSQYQQEPVAIGGNIIKGEHFSRYTVLPKVKWRKMFADTAQKTKEANDFSVFGEYGMGIDNKLYLIDQIRGKWEAPELQKRAIAFWNKCKGRDVEAYGQLREMQVEDKSSGTGLIQTIRMMNNIPIKPIERVKDKLTRVMDMVPYIEVGSVCLPEAAPFTNDFVAECEAFTADDSHDYDDQVDTLCDAVNDMLSAGNKMKQWEQIGGRSGQ